MRKVLLIKSVASSEVMDISFALKRVLVTGAGKGIAHRHSAIGLLFS